MDAKIIGTRLVKLRGSRTQLEVANECCIPATVLDAYERGERIPRDEIKLKLAAFYGVTVESIFIEK